MNFPTSYSSSAPRNVTGTVPKSALDSTGRPGPTITGNFNVTSKGAPISGGDQSPSGGDDSNLAETQKNQLPEAQKATEADGVAGAKGSGDSSEKVNDKKTFCIELLVGGCVQSFVDFLKITHNLEKEEENPDETLSDAKNEKRLKDKVDIVFLKESLEKAETARSLGNYNSSLEQFNTLAQYFANLGTTTGSSSSSSSAAAGGPGSSDGPNSTDITTATGAGAGGVGGGAGGPDSSKGGGAGPGGQGSQQTGDLQSAKYFYDRALEVAQESGDGLQIASASLNLGCCEESLGNWHSAMSCHETALELASELTSSVSTGKSNALPLQIRSAVQLCGVYRVLADQLLAGEKTPQNVSAAGDLFEKCVACAKLSRDERLEGANCYRLGKVKILSGDYNESLELQKHYLEICLANGDASGEAQARGALAQSYEVLGNVGRAIEELEKLLQVAAEAGETEAQCQACLNLGLLYSEGDSYEMSIQLLERHFELARQLSDKNLVESARVILGIARGNGKLSQYMGLVCSNNDGSLKKLLDWKSRRVPLGGSEAGKD